MSENNKNNICLDCLECCKNISLSMEVKGDLYNYIEFANVRGIEYIKVKDNMIYFLIPFPCRYLTEDGCKIYNMRPEVCRMYYGCFDPAMEDRCKL